MIVFITVIPLFTSIIDISPSSPTVNTPMTISVTDSNAGMIYFVELYNKCAMNNFEWSPETIRDQVLDDETEHQMTDVGGNTYSYTFTPTRPGDISILVKKYTNGGVYVEYFPNDDYSGTSTYNEVVSVINFNYNTGEVFPGWTEYCSAKFYFKAQPPVTTVVNFYVEADTGGELYIEGNLVASAAGLGAFTRGDYAMDQNTLHTSQLNFYERTGPANVSLYGVFGGGSDTIIPSTSLYYPEIIGSLQQITIGWTGNQIKVADSSDGRPVWGDSCGDGTHQSWEEWENGGSTGYGCSATCTIDNGYICPSGVISNANQWSNCGPTQVPNAAKNAWVDPPTCGNGFRIDPEKWDDENYIDGDGCSSTCSIEDDYICTGGSSTNKDTWVKCENNSEPNAEKTEWVTNEEGYSKRDAAIYSSTVSTLVVLSLLINLGNSLKSGASAQSSFIGIFAVQTIILLPEIGSSVPLVIGKTIYNLKEFLFTFDFIPDDYIPYYSDIDSTFSNSRNLIENNNFDITKHESSFMNLLRLMIICIIIVPLFQLLILFISKLFARGKESWMEKMSDKLIRFFFFNSYIRILMLIYMFLMFVTFPELYNWKEQKKGEQASRFFALAVAILIIGTLLFSTIFWILYGKQLEEEENEHEDNSEENKPKGMWSACFSGMKNSRLSKLSTLMFFLKRFLLCSLIFLLPTLSTNVKIFIVLGIQICFFVVIILVRSPKLIKDQVLEIINESVFIILIIWLYVQENDSNNKKMKENLFLFIIFTSFGIQLFISLGKEDWIINIVVLLAVCCKSQKGNKITILKRNQPQQKEEGQGVRYPSNITKKTIVESEFFYPNKAIGMFVSLYFWLLFGQFEFFSTLK